MVSLVTLTHNLHLHFFLPHCSTLTEPDHTADDLSNSLKNGLLYMQDPINKVNPNCFVW